MGWNLCTDKVHDYAWQVDVFNKDECKKIIQLQNTLEKCEAKTFSKIKNYYRQKTNLYWISVNNETIWIYKRLASSIFYLNEKYFQFDISAINESLQLTHYHGQGARYKKHIDRRLDMSVRKLTASIQLSEPTDYEGCDLKMYFEEEPTIAKRDIGSLTLYPSWALHEVSELKKGERHSLVCWVTGKQFL